MNSSALQRYVPLLSWIVIVGACIFIPLKVISYAFVPGGDARRHVARATIEKDYPEIVVLRPEYKLDHSPGWDWILRRVHRATGWGEDNLMSFSIVLTMLFILMAGLPWLRRPEAWLAALLAQLVALPDLMVRLDQARPFLLSEAVLICLLFAWTKDRTQAPSWLKIALTIVGFALSVWVHGAWYLWVFFLGAFFMAGAWPQAIWLSGCWVVGTIVGASLSGHPVALLYEAVYMVASVSKQHAPAWMLVVNFNRAKGSFIRSPFWRWFISGGSNKTRRGEDLREPVFWMIAIGWTLGFKADRFWADWGMPAATVWLALQFDEAMLEMWPAAAPRRLLLCALIAAPLYLDSTSDLGVRYTRNQQEAFVDANNPALQGWLPEDGGIFYSADMAFFYNTFYKNPQANWRYILGFEPALMPEDDLKILREIQWSRYDWSSYTPWIKKMRPQDRLEIPTSAQPPIPELEWRLAAKDIWIGRLPRNN